VREVGKYIKNSVESKCLFITAGYELAPSLLSAIVNKKMRDEGLFMSLVIHYWVWIGGVQDSQGVSASEMTYIVSSGALNSTHSLTHSDNLC